jgi:hypothetical protein
METTDITGRILGEVRDELKGLSGRVDVLTERVDGVEERLDEMGRSIVEAEVRTATALTELAGAVQSVKDLLVVRLGLDDRVTKCETEIRGIKKHVGM